MPTNTIDSRDICPHRVADLLLSASPSQLERQQNEATFNLTEGGNRQIPPRQSG